MATSTFYSLFLSLFLFLTLSLACTGVQPGSNPLLTRLPYLNAVSSSSATVLWGTVASLPAETVGEVVLTHEATGQSISAFARNYILSGFLTQDTRLFYADVTGLMPNTAYCYRIKANGTELAGGLTFRTAPDSSFNDTIRFVAIGDFGAGTPGQRKIRDGLTTKVGQSDLFLALGDNVYLTGTQQQYDAYNFGVYGDMWMTLPLYLSIGNHDWYHDRAATYLRNYLQKREAGLKEEDLGRWFSWDWGFIHFVNLDTEQSLDADPTDPQSMVSWLERDLKATNQPWKIVMFHKPPYTKSRIADERVVELLIPLFEKYRVQVVLGGHWHDYQRYPPLLNNQQVPVSQGGVLYITSGGGGYPVFGELVETGDGGWIYDPNKESPYHVYGAAPAEPDVYRRQQHFIYCEISRCTFTIQAINEDLEEIDNFSTSIC